MQNLLADTQYAFCTTNMWFNFQAHHHCEYAAMETQGQATQANHYRMYRFIIEKQTIMKLSNIVSIASATIVIAKKALSRSTTVQLFSRSTNLLTPLAFFSCAKQIYAFLLKNTTPC